MMGCAEHGFVMYAEMARCFCRPMLPPSGLSAGSITPHCDPCSWRGPVTLALASIGRFNLRRCEMKELYDSRFKSCTIPSTSVPSVAPMVPLYSLDLSSVWTVAAHLPLNDFLKPASIRRSPKISL